MTNMESTNIESEIERSINPGESRTNLSQESFKADTSQNRPPLTPDQKENTTFFYARANALISTGYGFNLKSSDLCLDENNFKIVVNNRTELKALYLLLDDVETNIFRQKLIERYEAKKDEHPEILENNEKNELKKEAFKEALEFVEKNGENFLKFVKFNIEYNQPIDNEMFIKKCGGVGLTSEQYDTLKENRAIEKFQELFNEKINDPDSVRKKSIFSFFKRENQIPVLKESVLTDIKRISSEYINKALPYIHHDYVLVVNLDSNKILF